MKSRIICCLILESLLIARCEIAQAQAKSSMPRNPQAEERAILSRRSTRPGASGGRVAPGHYDNAAGSYAVRHRDRRAALPVAAPPDPAHARAARSI